MLRYDIIILLFCKEGSLVWCNDKAAIPFTHDIYRHRIEWRTN